MQPRESWFAPRKSKNEIARFRGPQAAKSCNLKSRQVGKNRLAFSRLAFVHGRLFRPFVPGMDFPYAAPFLSLTQSAVATGAPQPRLDYQRLLMACGRSAFVADIHDTAFAVLSFSQQSSFGIPFTCELISELPVLYALPFGAWLINRDRASSRTRYPQSARQ